MVWVGGGEKKGGGGAGGGSKALSHRLVRLCALLLSEHAVFLSHKNTHRT